MAKLSKQDKIEIFNLWRNYNIRPSELGRRYGINPANINYLLALIQRHGLAILDQPYTEYSLEFKKQAIIRVLVKHEPAYQVTLDLGLKSNGMLTNWLRSYRENGYNVVIKQKGRLPMPKQDPEIKRLKQENEHLRQQNLKLTVENEFIKKLTALVDRRTKNRKPRK